MSNNYIVWFFKYPFYQNGINGILVQLWKLLNLNIFWRNIVLIYIHVRTGCDMKETYCAFTLPNKILGSIKSNRSNHDNEIDHFSFLKLKLDQNAIFSHSVPLICYNSDFNINTEEKHVKHNLKNIGCYGLWIPWQRVHILFPRKIYILIEINENRDSWALTCISFVNVLIIVLGSFLSCKLWWK